MQDYVKIILVILVIAVILSSVGSYWNVEDAEMSEGFHSYGGYRYPYRRDGYYGCSQCGYLGRIGCANCPNCGLCTTNNGRSECVAANNGVPAFRRDCTLWDYMGQRSVNPYAPRYPYRYPRRYPQRRRWWWFW